MTPALFETARLSCRRWRRDDLDALFAVYADPLAMRFVGDGQPITREQCHEWLDVTERNYAQRGYGMFALEDRTSGTVVGFCGLVHPGGQEEPEVKYAFRRSVWGRGLASEMVPALLAHGNQTHGLTRIIATVAPGNEPSQRVLLKAGAVRQPDRVNGDGSTTWVYEWHAPRTA